MNTVNNAVKPIYLDPTQPIKQRVADLLERMTLDEKIAQMHALWLILSQDGNHQARPDEAFIGTTDQASLKSRLANGLGQITRPLGTHSIDPENGLKALNKLQHYLRTETRLGIPAIAHEECLVGLMTRDATAFPSSLGLSSSWNPELVQTVAEHIREESQAVGCQQGLAPVLDVSRDIRWGRTEETFGEDPYLVGVMATRYVQGLQGPKRDLLATLKHYVGHSFSEGARNHAPVHVGWKTLNDIFMLPFEMAVKLANAGSVMPAYHDIDGEPVHASHYLLTQVLRQEWGFDGLIVADYVGVNLLYQHHGVAKNATQAAALSFNAGLDVELPGDDCAKHLTEAIDQGLINISTIDDAVSRILTEKFRLGLFEQDFNRFNKPILRKKETVAVAREAARQSIVIMSNKGILPLNKQKIAIIGPTADDPMAQLSGYSYAAHVVLQELTENTEHIITPRQGLESLFGPENVHYAKGCYILEERKKGAPVFPGDVKAYDPSIRPSSAVSQRTDLIDEAVNVALSSDVAIVCVGDLSGLFQTGTIAEGSDTDSLDLPGVQQELLEAIVNTGKPTIVVLTGGRPYNLGGLEKRLAAQVMSFAGGQEGGIALAEVLAGVIEPSGRLTISTPRNVGAMPYYYNHKVKSGGTPIALHFGSDFAFGHGLSYTEFAYSNLNLINSTIDIDTGSIQFTCTISNIGNRKGTEIVQVYIRDQHASVVRPVKELKAFQRVDLEANESLNISVTIPVDMLNFTGMNGKRQVEPGSFDIMVGSSSQDIKLQTTIEVVGKSARILGKNWNMLSTCIVNKT